MNEEPSEISSVIQSSMTGAIRNKYKQNSKIKALNNDKKAMKNQIEDLKA